MAARMPRLPGHGVRDENLSRAVEPPGRFKPGHAVQCGVPVSRERGVVSEGGSAQPPRLHSRTASANARQSA
jgi:hypothetical protein